MSVFIRATILLGVVLLFPATVEAQYHSRWIVDGTLEQSPFSFPFDVSEVRSVNHEGKQEIWHLTSVPYDDVLARFRKSWKRFESIGGEYYVKGVTFLYQSQTHIITVQKAGTMRILELRPKEGGGTIVALHAMAMGRIQGAIKRSYSPYEIGAESVPMPRFE